MFEQQRWEAEQKFFDDEEYTEGPLPEETIRRYTLCRKPFLSAEYPFWRIGDVRGKKVLEVGCGDGGNAVLWALKGATVVGVDISPRAIEIARDRARLHGVDDRTEFYALPLEAYLEQHRPGKFDVICGFAFLHHVIPVMESVLASLRSLGHERTVFLFMEPVAISAALRKLRLALPLRVHGTPDERPLAKGEIEILRRSFPGLKIRYFQFLTRPWKRFIGGRYEDYPPLKRAVCDLLSRLDEALLLIPGSGALACQAAIYHVPGQDR
jgi:SAM-dependent methyltransferase